MRINVVSFDADGTIVKNSYVELFWFRELPRLYADKKGVAFSAAQKTLSSLYDEMGDEDIRWYSPEYWFERFELEKEPEEVIEKIQVPENVELYRDAVEVVDELCHDYKLIITSNSPRIFLDYALRELEDRFHKIYSCVTDFGEVKKRPGVYRKVASRVGVKAEEMVHVGDHWRFDYRAPRELGVQSFYIDRDGSRTEEGDHVLTDLREMTGSIDGLTGRN